MLALAWLALAPAAQAAISQTPDVVDTRFESKLVSETPVVTGVTWIVIDRNDELDVDRTHQRRLSPNVPPTHSQAR